MRTFTVDLGDRSYPIHIGSGLLAAGQLLVDHIPGQQVLIVTNDVVAPLYLERLRASLQQERIEVLVLADGEKHKTWETLSRIFDVLLELRFDRNCTLIALGGGVVGDVTGFAAACYQRGVNLIQVPTTLLAQVDSSVGGKTAINHPQGKNMIGAFYQPSCVVADTSTLASLPDRELSAGLAEVLKYGFICDREFLDWLDQNLSRLVARDSAALDYAVRRSCELKAQIVVADETERGQRALLNLGHTFGHAIEAGLGFGVWLHGEAVAAGTVMAADLSARLGWLAASDVARVKRLLKTAGLPISGPPELANDTYSRLMAIDKKVLDGKLRLILLKSLGEAVVADNIAPELIAATLTECRQ